MTLLEDGLTKLNFSLDKISFLAPKMETYIKELILFNSAYNLVNTNDHDKIVIYHILDSLAAYKTISSLAKNFISKTKKNPIIADIGSGAGFPGIPLATYFNQYEFKLIERMEKRAAFLQNQVAILKLQNVQVLNTQAENVQKQSIDIAVFRAFSTLDKKTLKTLQSLVSQNGALVAYKAVKEKIIQEMNTLNFSQDDYIIKPLNVPFLTDTQNKDAHERNLVIIAR